MSISRRLASVALVWGWLGCAGALAGAAADSVVLENQWLALVFDSRTGAWNGLRDKKTGDNLVVQGVPPVPPLPRRLDAGRIDAAVGRKRALRLDGEWQYTPVPPSNSPEARFLKGEFDGAAWAPTPVPSQRGVGDDRLHERTGDFWYRRHFAVPADWPEAEMVLVIGAVDDFDVAWVNGARIGRTGQDTPHFWETPRFYRFPARCLRRGATNTVLLKVTNGAYDGGVAGPVALGLASALEEPAATLPPARVNPVAGPPQRLEIVCSSGGCEYRWEFEMSASRAAFSRQLTVRNVSSAEQVFQTAAYTAPACVLGPAQAAIFPGSLPVGDQPLSEIPEGESLGPRSQEPLVALWDAASMRGLGAWFHSEEEYAPVSVTRIGQGSSIRHSQQVVARLRPGEALTLGRQHFWLSHGARDETLRGVQAVYGQVGLRAPEGSLPGLRSMVLYCGHPGGPPELRFLDYGGFKALEAYVPTLKRLRVDLLWLLPTWAHGDGRRWNLYAPFDHYQVDPLLGTAADLKALQGACAAAGIRLMFDLVPHGPPDFTPLAKAHPEWAARKPDGSIQYEWGQLAFDNHHPGWQDYMRKAAEWGAREFGAVGARVDCGAGGPLNWNREVTSRPSLSTLAGGLGMNAAIRDGYRRAHPGVVILPEEYTGATIFNRVADLTYDAQLYFLQADLLERGAAPSEWARLFQQFLHDQQATLPPGGLKMRWISNHDTVSWTFQKRRPAKAYGEGRLRALLALCALIEGAPMLYQGDEDPAVYRQAGPSQVEYLGRLHGLRKDLAALRDGAADYASLRASEGVFACLRQHDRQEAIVLISFNPAPARCRLSLPGGLQGRWKDALGGELFDLADGVSLPMSPWQTRVLRLAPAP